MAIRLLPLFGFLVAALACLPAAGETRDDFDIGSSNLMAVLRESAGANKQDESLQPYGAVRALLVDGREIELEPSWYEYLGDMHIRLVFDGPQTMQSASPEDLTRLRLAPDEALQLAVENLRRVYGEPIAQPWAGGLMQVQGNAPHLNSSYFLDREFWGRLQHAHPQGLVAAVPRRGGLVFAPVDDEEAVAHLRFSAAALYAGGERSRVSSALYLFKDGHWSVFQSPTRP